ncbi:MAG: VWA domain-containing protein [Myxococcales bacterium]|nr:VWA domain-containing protein [Myxococcales bacterium]
MLVDRFNSLGERLDALKAGRPPPLGILERARALFARDDGVASLDALVALDRDLERAGVHTAADARLLRELGAAKGRLKELSLGLAARAISSLGQYEEAMAEAERIAGLSETPVALMRQLDEAFGRLARIVKVAAAFERPPGEPQGPLELFPRPRASRLSAPSSARLAIAEFLSERAKAAVEDSAQKRRDLELAYELVLRLSADAQADRDRIRALRVQLGAARDRVRSSPAVRSYDELIRHLRHTARRDPRTAYKSLKALYDRAVEAGDEQLTSVAAGAVQALLPEDGAAAAKLVEQDEVKRTLGYREPARVEQREKLPAGGKGGMEDEVADVLTQLAFELDEDQQKALELAAGCARYFDVEDSLSEELVEAELKATRPVQRRVAYPTQTMTYEFTHRIDDLEHFVVSHPGALILDLAAGRQMVRSYLEEEPPPKPKRVKKTAVRVYVLDASGSMHGARARFRDAILIAELNAIRVKAKVGLPFDPLYFSFFNDVPTELSRVEGGADAARQIEKLFHESPAEGQTDISLALMAAFDSIGKAQGKDPYLARATVVLVTDGEDGVDLELIRKTKKPYEGMDIDLSFISLGEENPDLKALVLEQRRGGGRAFYHHLSDSEIQLARTEFDSAWRTLLPAEAPLSDDVLEKLLPHLEALEAIAAGRPPRPPERLDTQFDALFPERPGKGRAPARLLARLVDVLEAVAEAASLAPAELRAAEAVTLLTHLLGVYELTPQQYLAAVGTPDEGLSRALARVRLTCKPFA